MKTSWIYLITLCGIWSACNPRPGVHEAAPARAETQDSASTTAGAAKAPPKESTADDIYVEKWLWYEKYTLESVYPYKDTTRCFQWNKIKERLALLENAGRAPGPWGILQNYKNRNGEAPLVRRFIRNEYDRVADTLGVERYQSVPLYLPTDSSVPERYGQDGEPVRIAGAKGGFVKTRPLFTGGEWLVPKKYVKNLGDTIELWHAIFVDRHNQNIATMERVGRHHWRIRSMNPATTGLHRPPYAHETPLGIFMLQEKKRKMIYLKDGSKATAGYAPHASRFTDGAYIHGVPVALPRTAEIEYSWSLGTTPRSHMCVRTATSHAKFIYDWAPVNETVVFVLE